MCLRKIKHIYESMAGDRIFEAYEGKVSDAMRESTQKRMQWFQDHISGSSILDIGCSQGLLPILCGRDGKRVVAIDNDKESIDFACSKLAQEDEQVNDNVQFVCGDFLMFESTPKFDTIIMGEILEHLDEPEKFLDKASKFLMDDGKILVSVPFGINRYPDHKTTFYFYNFYHLMNKYFEVQDVKFMGAWVAIIGGKKDNSNSKEISVYNEAFALKYEEAVCELDLLREKTINRYIDSYRRCKEQLDKLKLVKVEIKELKEKNKNLKERYENLERRNQNLEKKYNALCSSKLGSLQLKIWEKRNSR